MPRTKGGYKTRQRRNRVLKMAQGYWGARRKLYSIARETVDRALAYAFTGRKLKKRQFRALLDSAHQRRCSASRPKLQPLYPWLGQSRC